LERKLNSTKDINRCKADNIPNKGGRLRLSLGNGKNMEEIKIIAEIAELIANTVKTVWETIKTIKDRKKPPVK
jgi:hypothetical protein